MQSELDSLLNQKTSSDRPWSTYATSGFDASNYCLLGRCADVGGSCSPLIVHFQRPGSVYMRSMCVCSQMHMARKSHRMLDTTYGLSTSYTYSPSKICPFHSSSCVAMLHAIIKQLASVVEICAAAEAAVRFSPVVASDIMRW